MNGREGNPWRRLKTTEIYENPWIAVRHDDVVTPGGKPGIYGRVCFRNHALGIVPVDGELHTWLVGQYRYPLDEYCWEIPEGGGAKGVPRLESAQRELREETGLVAKSWREIQRFHLSNSVTDETGWIFLAQELEQFAPQPEDTEELQVRRLPLAEALAMVMRSEITDSMSVAGILKVARILKAELGEVPWE